MTNPVKQLGMELGDYVDELTRPHTHREHYTAKVGHTTFGMDHVLRTPSLILQLLAGDIPSAAAEEGPRAGFTSKPAARLEALDAAIRIDLGAARWVRDLGEDDPGDTWDPTTRTYLTGSGTIACIRLLYGLAASADRCRRPKAGRDKETNKVNCCTWHQIEHDIRSWWTQARIVTGWDAAAWAPDNTCPMCAERGTLKIRLVEQIGMCTKCRSTWDSTNIGLLAEHIRSESSAERKPKQRRGPCWCPWPKPIVPDLSRLCPVCGSARCRHAIDTPASNRVVDNTQDRAS